jgi:hypothetical protein
VAISTSVPSSSSSLRAEPAARALREHDLHAVATDEQRLFL